MIELKQVEKIMPQSLRDRLYWKNMDTVAAMLPGCRSVPFLDWDMCVMNDRYPGVSMSSTARLLRSMSSRIRRYMILKLWTEDCARARRWMSQHAEVRNVHREYIDKTKSTGIADNDYVRLYLYCRAIKPRYVLECGTGLSTTAIGQALRDNDKQDGCKGELISMEDVKQWHEQARRLLPVALTDYVQICHSPRVVRERAGVKGVGYESVPEHSYDMMFIDGPTEEHPETGEKLFNIDAYDVVKRNADVIGLVDHRLNTVRHMRKMLEDTHRVVFHPVHDLGYIVPRDFEW